MKQKNISADDMILFATIAEQASLVRAAEQLGMPKATVSRRLTNLEALLGQRLLIRTTRRLTLTEFGQEFFEHSRRVAEEVATVQDFARSQEVRLYGKLRVSMPEDYARRTLSRALATFIEAYPEIELELDLSARMVDLIGERFDLAIRIGVLSNDSTLVARKLDEQQLGLYASPIYLGTHPAPQHPDGLQQHAALRMASYSGQPLSWRLLRGKETWEGVPPGRIALNSISTIQQLLLDGSGIGMLPLSFAEEDVLNKRLVRVLPEWSFPAVSVWAVTPMRRYLPAKTRVFLTHVERFLNKG
ncbi:MAG TPA: LysR family transcriptional regulator [Gallionella sp.]|nr:LysR family transcriptional regulator [Gallionella sp.]